MRALFNRHVFELGSFKDFAAFLALDVFGVFFAGYDLNARVLAHTCHADSLWRSVRGKIGWFSFISGRLQRRNLRVF